MIDSGIGVFHFLVLGFILFITGILGIIISKNLIKILFSVIIMLNSLCINFVAISRFCDGMKLEGDTFCVFISVLSLIYTVIFVSLIINYSKTNGKDNSAG